MVRAYVYVCVCARECVCMCVCKCVCATRTARTGDGRKSRNAASMVESFFTERLVPRHCQVVVPSSSVSVVCSAPPSPPSNSRADMFVYLAKKVTGSGGDCSTMRARVSPHPCVAQNLLSLFSRPDRHSQQHPASVHQLEQRPWLDCVRWREQPAQGCAARVAGRCQEEPGRHNAHYEPVSRRPQG